MAGGARGISRQPLEQGPQVTRLDRLTARRPDHDAPSLTHAVPGFGGGDARDLVGDIRRRRRRVEQDGQRLQPGRLVLAHDQLAEPGARTPVDTAQRIARPVLADTEQLVARSGSWRRHARLELAHLAAVAERGEPRQDYRDLRIGNPAEYEEEAQQAHLEHSPSAPCNWTDTQRYQ